MPKNRIFVDGMDAISLSDGLVRMNLFNHDGTEEGAKIEMTNELIMTPQAFLKAFGAMEDLVNKLVEAGMISKRGTAQPEAGKSISVNGNEVVSPNFK